MKKLSALIFTNDSSNKTLGLVKHLVGTCEQIVLMDSSSASNHKKLKSAVSRLGDKGVEIYRVLALGYADPLRAYGLAKCKNDWVLYIDTDERISKDLKDNIKSIIEKPGCSAFAIKRYEHAHMGGERGDFFTWQTRLYNKKAIRYRGLLHEQPLIVKGRLGSLDDNYCIMHVEELKTKGKKRRDFEYGKIKGYYDRLTYSMLNNRMEEYIGKLMPHAKKPKDTTLGKIVLGWMRFYQKLTFRKPESEISTFDYFVLFSMLEGTYVMKQKSVNYLFSEAIPTILKDTKDADAFKKDKHRKEVFEISKSVNKHGIIEYLMLDKDEVVEKLYRKYSGKEQGIGLLIKLLEDRHSGIYP